MKLPYLCIGFCVYVSRFGGGHRSPLHYSCQENPLGRGTWQATVHTVAKSQTSLKQLSTHASICWDKLPKVQLLGPMVVACLVFKKLLRDWGQEEKGMTEDEMVGWHH